MFTILVVETVSQLTETTLAMIDVLISNFHFVILGTLFGMFAGLLPGLGGAVGIALLLPFTLNMEPEPAFILFAATMGGTSFAGSLTAILVNAPGTAGNAATLLDGYPMTREGRAKEALGAAATASATGALFGLVLFFMTIPLLQQFAALFGSREIFWLAIAGIAVIPAIVSGSVIKGLISGCLGLLFALHGFDYLTGNFRYPYLYEISNNGDIALVPVIVGLFAIAEMLRLGMKNEKIAKETDEEGTFTGNLWKGIKAPFVHYYTFVQSSIVGFVVGVIPGVGGSVANVVAYGFAKNLPDTLKTEFGTGNVRGIIASESANDSKDGGQLIPTLGLGIPGSGSTAVLLGAFLAHGLIPGPHFITEQLHLAILIFLSLLASNILTSAIGLALADYLVKVVEIDISYLIPIIIGLATAASFVTRNDTGDMLMAIAFGILGLVLIFMNVSRIPLLVAFILAEIIEGNFFRTIRLSNGDPSYFVGSPLSLVLVLLVVVVLVYPVWEKRRHGEAI